MNRDALGRDWGVVHNYVRTIPGKPGETTLIEERGAGLWHGYDARGIAEKKMPGGPLKKEMTTHSSILA